VEAGTPAEALDCANSRGNTTDSHRRAYVLNYRSAAMIQRERDNGMDHGLTTNEHTVRSTDATS
jgi:phytanoyl-CoA hydroxylase